MASNNGVPLLDVPRGNQPLRDEILQAFADVFDSGRFLHGPHVRQLEDRVAALCGTEHAIGCASGSDALLLSLMALGIEPGDEVIAPSFSFFATVSAITRLGAVPVFADIVPETFNVCPDSVQRAITPRTKAIIPVHLFGQPAKMVEICEIAERSKIKVIEDAAQAIGSNLGGKGVGSLGDVGCFSFYPTKNLGGLGDGGMLVTNDQPIADRLRLFAAHGMRPRYEHKVVGINSRLDTMQAAALLVKLGRLEEWTEQRRANALRYQALFAQRGLNEQLGIPDEIDGRHVWNQFTIRVPRDARGALRETLAQQGIGAEIYYPIPIHRQACFHDTPMVIGDLPETDKAAAEVLSLPIFPELTEGEQTQVVDAIDDFVNNRRASAA
jgi:dTDP-4-amino-4,6-dideoxygalactose transaminase